MIKITLKPYDIKKYLCLHCLSKGIITEFEFDDDCSKNTCECGWTTILDDEVGYMIPIVSIYITTGDYFNPQLCYPEISSDVIELLPEKTKEAFLQFLKNEVIIPSDVLEWVIDLYDRSLDKESYANLKKEGHLTPKIESKLKEIGISDDPAQFDLKGLTKALAETIGKYRKEQTVLTQKQRMLLHKLCNKNIAKLEKKRQIIKTTINTALFLQSSDFCRKSTDDFECLEQDKCDTYLEGKCPHSKDCPEFKPKS